MYMPALAAGMAVMILGAAPMAGHAVRDVFKPINVFQPLNCAMANSGSCDDTANKASPARSSRQSDVYLMASPEPRPETAG